MRWKITVNNFASKFQDLTLSERLALDVDLENFAYKKREWPQIIVRFVGDAGAWRPEHLGRCMRMILNARNSFSHQGNGGQRRRTNPNPKLKLRSQRESHLSLHKRSWLSRLVLTATSMIISSKWLYFFSTIIPKLWVAIKLNIQNQLCRTHHLLLYRILYQTAKTQRTDEEDDDRQEEKESVSGISQARASPSPSLSLVIQFVLNKISY